MPLNLKVVFPFVLKKTAPSLVGFDRCFALQFQRNSLSYPVEDGKKNDFQGTPSFAII